MAADSGLEPDHEPDLSEFVLARIAEERHVRPHLPADLDQPQTGGAVGQDVGAPTGPLIAVVRGTLVLGDARQDELAQIRLVIGFETRVRCHGPHPGPGIPEWE